jgi:hypothetical protein
LFIHLQASLLASAGEGDGCGYEDGRGDVWAELYKVEESVVCIKRAEAAEQKEEDLIWDWAGCRLDRLALDMHWERMKIASSSKAKQWK